MTIVLRDVAFSYDGSRTALKVPSLEISKGLTLVVGPNGAGKSTLLRIAAGVDAPKRGIVTIDGADLWRDEVAARQQVAFVPEHPELTPYASVLDVLRLVAELRGASLSDVVDALDRVGLFEQGLRTIRELSMGQRRRAMLATALIGAPRIIILDEPLETLDAAMRAFVRDWVVALRASGATIVVATHELPSFAAHTDWAISIRNGTIARHDLSNEGDSASRLARLEHLARGSERDASVNDA
jgi:ABC-2 type transport system ATP-binding protein